MKRRTGAWFVLRGGKAVPAAAPGEYVGRHRGDGEGRGEQPRTGRHTPEYVAMHERTRGMYPMGGAGRVGAADFFAGDVDEDRSDGIWRP